MQNKVAVVIVKVNAGRFQAEKKQVNCENYNNSIKIKR